MKTTHSMFRIAAVTVLLLSLATGGRADAAAMADYCVSPPFITQSVPPLVMLAMGRDHKIYYEAFNDAYDLDNDGRIDTGYKHSIDYYGYFDPNRCYTYTSTGTARFVPAATPTTDKFCSAGQWSGNVLNYLTMSKIDVIKKVFFGGHRSTDSASSTVLERAIIPQDAHSWGKEFSGRLCFDGSAYAEQCMVDADCNSGSTCIDKSINLIGIAAPAGPGVCNPIQKMCTTNSNVVSNPCTADADCAATEQCVVPSTSGKILVAKYGHAASKTYPGNHTNMMASYEPDNLQSYTYLSDLAYNNLTIKPTTDHGDNYNFIAVSEFEVTAANSGNWQFFIDGDDDVEVELDGVVVASYYGAHAACGTTGTGSNVQPRTCSATQQSLAIDLRTNNGRYGTEWHTVFIRHFEKGGQDGFTLWYKKPGDTKWYAYGAGSGTHTLNLRSPSITASNECALKNPDFVANGTLATSPFSYGSAKHHLFCNTTTSATGAPLLRMLTDRTERIWNWASKERPVCDNSIATPTDYEVRVEVCSNAEATAPTTTYFNNYCKSYGGGIYRPVGLLQKYGEGDGTKVCSKFFTKSCNTSSDCTAGEGICIDKVKMLFGLITGSYDKNMSGGVLRKNIWSILDETNTNGTFQTSENVEGNIVITLDRLATVGFNYTTYQYDCGWITNRSMNEAECKMWGNPMAEILYETTRYFADKGTPTADYMYSANADGGLSLSKLGVANKPWIRPYSDYYPSCALPFVLSFSDISPSYDSDQVPGTSFGSFAGDLSTLDVTALANTIGTQEGIAGTNRFIGQSGTLVDFLCSSKSVTNLGTVRGLCPEEPTKQGSYYSAAVAYYGKDRLRVCSNEQSRVCSTSADCASGGSCGKRNITTYGVALSSPVPDISLKIGGRTVQFIPTGKSVSGCLGVDQACGQKCTVTTDANGSIVLSSCQANSYCPTNQIVDFYIDTIRYDASNNITYAKFKINFEDVEQGADHDMDAIVSYEIEPDRFNPGQITVKLTSEYAAGCINQALGFIIKGTTEDGVYLTVRDADTAPTETYIGSKLPLEWQRNFTVVGTSDQSLESPLWYAAKWGGFQDQNGNGMPDLQSEWDKDGDGIPDTYFLVVNPLRMEQQLETALLSILRRASSGTAASVLASGEGSGANLVQAIFYPKKLFQASNTELSWIGTLQNFWYFLDLNIGASTIREDTTQDRILSLTQDYIANFFFDTSEQRTKAARYTSDASGNILAQQTTVYMEDLKTLWEAGLQLWNTPAANRTIYTTLDGVSMLSGGFDTANANSLRTSLQAADVTEATNIIRYVRGEDISGWRPRTTAIDLNGDNIISGASEAARVWKLGDIVSSTPKIASWSPALNKYDTVYGDNTYKGFYTSNAYLRRGTVFTGANDGMLHAFRLGHLEVVNNGTATKAKLCDDTNSDGVCADAERAATTLGQEQWAFIPKNALPYLKYMADPAYCHLYYVDATPFLFDASINPDTGADPSPGCASDYTQCMKTVNSWRTILIGGMRLGGACKSTPTSQGVTIPASGIGYSSYFALDVTDPANPTLLWEFSDPNLGFSTSGPAVIRINSRDVNAGISQPNRDKNGKWFVVFGSGPTGPIEGQQFKGHSDQNLRFFVLDLKTGSLLRTIDTGVANAFSGSMVNSQMDLDRDYQDDALYIGFTKLESGGTTEWKQGGILRIVTKEDLEGNDISATGNTALNPANWQNSMVLDNIGPVTSALGTAIFTPTGSNQASFLWLFFGTGRYFFRNDDIATQRIIGGLKEPCFNAILNVDSPKYDLTTTVCSASDSYVLSDLKDTTVDVKVRANNITSDTQYQKGWFINLDSPTNFATNGVESFVKPTAERMVTDPLVTPSGAVFFTTFLPSGDICQYGGTSYIWAVKYDNGQSAVAAGLLKGKGLLQVSTGEIASIDFSTAFGTRYAVQADVAGTPLEGAGRRSTGVNGMPPTGQGLTVVVAPPPVKASVHIMKK